MSPPTTDPLHRELESSNYRFIRKLAAGGMGEVVVVEHVGLAEQRVMKLLKANLADNESLAVRLRTEARVVTRLSHPNLVRVLDFGITSSGRPYLVTELLHGMTIKDKLGKRGCFSEAEALEIARQALLGLEQVHDAGIVHRDIKPDNVFLCEKPGSRSSLGSEPIVKILDFGVARILAPEDRVALGQIQPTAEGLLVGTPSFISPEQAKGRPADTRADIYGMGCLLYCMVTGRNVFLQRDLVAILKAHAGEVPVPPSTVSAQLLSPAIDELILRALAKEPDDRFPTAREMRFAITALLSRTSPAAPAAAPSPPVQALLAPPPGRGDDDSQHATVYATSPHVEPSKGSPPGRGDDDSQHATVYATSPHVEPSKGSPAVVDASPNRGPQITPNSGAVGPRVKPLANRKGVITMFLFIAASIALLAFALSRIFGLR